ncbi:MAG: HAD-IB family hydrolase, partial [Actinomycetia bacterium]|nr:HAD-IB family hydrolase [Actinomycetes bacterium]
SEGRAGAAVFFDLDGTLVVGQTTLLLVGFLSKAGVVGRAFVLGTGLWFLGYKLGLVKVNEKSREKGAAVFRGLTEAEVEELMARFTDEVLVPRFHPAATAALAEHRAQGDRVVVVSAALEPVVRGLCRRLGVEEYVGAPCEVADRRYTGRLTGPSPHAEEKIRVATEYMARWVVDPSDCWAYADHITDLGLLRSVGHPVAVNPKPALRKAAEQAGWPILP